MAFDAKGIDKLKKDKLAQQKKEAKENKKAQKEREALYAAYEKRVTNAVLKAWEDFLDNDDSWHAELEEAITKSINEPEYYRFVLEIYVTHTTTKVIDEIVEEYHDDYEVSHFEYNIAEVTITTNRCDAITVKIPLDEAQRYNKKTYLNIADEVADAFVKTLRHNKIKAKCSEPFTKDGRSDYNNNVSTYHERIDVGVNFN